MGEECAARGFRLPNDLLNLLNSYSHDSRERRHATATVYADCETQQTAECLRRLFWVFKAEFWR